MPLSNDERAAFAADVPVYVEAAADGTYRLVSTETQEPVSVEHPTARSALERALGDGGDALIEPKRANLRTNGEPDGVWRWLDATAEEDEPIDGVRISERGIWEMAASLSRRDSAVPINGGGGPEGYRRSESHGDAYDGGDHPANGFAHVAVPVLAEDGRAHLFLYAELVEEIAREVDRGRLAYGSVRFAYASVNEDDNRSIQGAVLISHALTNDPAVTSLTAGSERRSDNLLTACRTRRSLSMPNDTKPTAQRGPASDKLREILAALGVDYSEEMEGDAWFSPAMDRISALKQQATVETIIEGGEAPPEGGEAAAEREAGDEGAGERALMGEEAETYAAAAADLFRTVLGKPDASEADLLEEMQARAEEIGAALGTDTPPDDGEEPPAEETAGAERSRDRLHVAELETLQTRNREQAKTIARFETRDWLTDSLRSIKKSLPTERFDRWVDIALESGRSVVEEMLENLNAPPTGEHPFARSAQRGPAPASIVEATMALMSEARAAMREERGDGEPVPNHLVVARAERMARARFPELAAG